MKRITKVSILILCLILATFVEGCTNNSKNSQKSINKDSIKSESYSKQEPYTCVILSTGPEANDRDCELVSEAASKITKAKFNTTIKVIRYPYGEYDNQLKLLLASKEKLDLFPSLGLSVTTAANTDQIYPLDKLLIQYGQDLLKKVPETDWSYSKVNGQIYSVCSNKEHAEGFGYCVVKSILDEMKVDPKSLKTEEDINQLFYKVKKKYPNMWAIAPDAGTMGYYNAYFDLLGGDYGILKDCRDSSTKVVDLYETNEYYNIILQRYNWVKNGIMMPDGSTDYTSVTELMKTGKVFASSSNIKPGKETEVLQYTKKNVLCIPITKNFLTTNSYGIQWFIARQSEKPERAMQILNEMYINPKLANILANGVENIHWKLVNKKNRTIDYPKGLSVTTSGYPASAWEWPNEMITYIWADSKPTLWKDTVEFNKNAISSPLSGFTWNNKNVLSEIASCNTVVQKYKNALECGELDPSVYIPRFIHELKVAGVDTIIEEKQRQVDLWLEDQNNK